MVVIGAAFWGISGTVAQTLFQDDHISVDWLVVIRLLISGMVLLGMALVGPNRRLVWEIWRNGKNAWQLVVFGVLGLLAVQYTYFAAVADGNAAVATLLQYLAPIFIATYFMIRWRTVPRLIEIIAMVLALIGTFLLLTNGNAASLHIPAPAVIWGILSGIALAFYTLYPGRLLKEYGAPIVIGWGMIIGGIGLSFRHAPWQIQASHWTLTTVLLTAFVILFGTALAFFLYLESQRYLSPKESSLLACTEPLTAVVSAVVWLGVPFGLYQVLGGGCVLCMVVLLAMKPVKKHNGKPAMMKSTQKSQI